MLENNLDSLKAIVFDFDGTLIESNELKRQIFFDIFDNKFHPQITKTLNENKDLSRFELIKKILIKINCKKISANLDEYTSRYSDNLINQISVITVDSNLYKNLENLKSRYKIYLSSLTYKNDLPVILKNLKLDKYFENVYGYPQKKEVTLKNIITRLSLSPSEVMVVGDGESDRISAKINNCHFFHINDKNNIKLFFKLING